MVDPGNRLDINMYELGRRPHLLHLGTCI